MLSWSELELLCDLIAEESPGSIAPSTNTLALISSEVRERTRFSGGPLAEVAALLYELLHDERRNLGTMRHQLAVFATYDLLSMNNLTIPDDRLLSFDRLMDDIAGDDLVPEEIAARLTDMVTKSRHHY